MSARPSLESTKKEDLSSPSPVVTAVDDAGALDAAFVRRTMRKVDLRLLPILGALYAFNLIDRSNLGLARIVGAGAELGLSQGSRYSIIALVYFPPYIVLELPSNILLRKVGPARWLGTISLLWGAAMLASGFVKNWQALAGLRALLGACEAGFFPGCIYLISVWYVRSEVQTRLAVFYLTSTFVGGFLPIFAYGVSTMGVVAGLQPWRWIFIICGIITCSFAILAYPLIVDFPDKAKFLSQEEIKLVRDRVEHDRADSEPDPLTWRKAGQYALDLKLWAFGIMYLCSTMPSYAFSYFLPVILNGMGFSVRDAQLLSSPPYIFAVLLGLLAARMSDKYNKRAPFILAQAAITIIGVCLTAFTTGNGSRYFGTFLGLFGCQANIPAVVAYQANNIAGQSKRSFSSALVVGLGGIGGIVASVAFREKDSPKYLPGLATTIACQGLMIACCLSTTAWFMYRNAQVRRGEGKLIEGRQGFFYTI
ncbi:MFS general substrate transporter [Exidia glandulosa HHB12029]|uniref:MFS general substrate transporter n=1 Tax=Exidia glandulosa HHB12029 TaxID=1314781 RepID=A0A165JQD6_EXIGL|nr:MFS general substrate transporter [Exidia glandulosa HHB12029]